VWTAPTGATVGRAVTLDATGSTGDGTLTCTWSFEDQSGATVWETVTGCKISKTFSNADTKYVKLTVRDADGDTDSNRQSFAVATTAADQPANAVWTAPASVRVNRAATLDGTASTGDGTLTCTWTFEDQTGETVWETVSGCKITKTFSNADTKYVNLTVRDADGDTDSNRQSFGVSR
jgi:hypothetical protein